MKNTGISLQFVFLGFAVSLLLVMIETVPQKRNIQHIWAGSKVAIVTPLHPTGE